MKVHIYTDIDTLFGRASRVWVDTLLVAGIYALPRFAKHGLPRHGKHVLCLRTCRLCVADVPRREAMVQASQLLLRGRFSPASWQSRMLSMIESAA